MPRKRDKNKKNEYFWIRLRGVCYIYQIPTHANFPFLLKNLMKEANDKATREWKAKWVN